MPRGLETLRETPIIPKHVVASPIPLHTVFGEMTPLLISEVAKRLQDLSKIGFCGLEIWEEPGSIEHIIANPQNCVDRQIGTNIIDDEPLDRRVAQARDE